MKKIFFIGVALMSIICSCQKNHAVISGTIEKYEKTTPLMLCDYILSNNPDSIPVTDGNFTQTIKLDYPQFTYLFYGNTRKMLFLAPGYSLKLSANATNLAKSFNFEGQGADEISVIDSISMKLASLDYSTIHGDSVEKSLNYIDSAYSMLKAYFEKLTASKKYDPIFITYEKKSLEYFAASNKMLVGLKNDVKDPSYFSFLSQLEIENEKYLGIQEYRTFINYYISLESLKILEAQDSINSSSVFTRIDAGLKAIEKLKTKSLREYLTFNQIIQLLNFHGVKNFEKYNDYITKNVKNPVLIKKFNEQYERKLLLAQGKQAPDFTCTDINGNDVSLKDFRGKFVYIDFWATWCSPCREEIPFYTKLKSDYKGQDIVFISISIDEDKKSWEDFVRMDNSDGVSLLEGKGWNSNIIKAYQIAGIPTFVLIDKEGKFIDSQAPRPSSDEIRKVLDGLIIVK